MFLFLSAAAALLSFMLLFSEITIPTGKNISPLNFIVQASLSNPLSEQIFTCLPISYLAMCAFYPLFIMRLSTFYYIGKRRTDENSLLLNATLVLRVSVPLAYNFVLLLQLSATSLQSFTGVISTIPFFGTSLNEWFPVIMCIVSFLTLINISDYVLRLLGREQFEYRHGGNHDEDTAVMIVEGRRIVAESKSKGAQERRAAAAAAAAAAGAASSSSSAFSAPASSASHNEYGYDRNTLMENVELQTQNGDDDQGNTMNDDDRVRKQLGLS